MAAGSGLGTLTGGRLGTHFRFYFGIWASTLKQAQPDECANESAVIDQQHAGQKDSSRRGAAPHREQAGLGPRPQRTYKGVRIRQEVSVPPALQREPAAVPEGGGP